MLRPVGTRKDFDSQHMGFPPGDDLDGGDEFWGDVVRNKVRQAFLFLQKTSGTPLTPLAPSSTPIRRVPPEVLANAAMVFSAPSGEERSRLNSSVLPSGRLRRETKSIALHFTLMQRRDCAFRAGSSRADAYKSLGVGKTEPDALWDFKLDLLQPTKQANMPSEMQKGSGSWPKKD